MEYKILICYTLWSNHSLWHTVSTQGKIQWESKWLIEEIPCPQCGFRQDLGSIAGLRLVSYTELEFGYNMNKNLPLKIVQMWDRGGNGHLNLKLKRSFHCLIFALLAKRLSAYIEIWLWQHTIYSLSFHDKWFPFQGEKGNLLPDFLKKGNFSCIKMSQGICFID